MSNDNGASSSRFGAWWKNANQWQRGTVFTAVALTVVVLFNFVLIPLIDKAQASEASIALVDEVIDPVDDLRFEAELLREPTCTQEGACADNSKRAARRFRDGKINKSVGFVPDRVFRVPSNAKDIFAEKFKRLIHRKFHSDSLVAADATVMLAAVDGLCTADTLECGREWYEKAINSKCVTTGSPFPSDEDACTEVVARPFEKQYTAENIRTTGNVFLCAGGIGIAVGTGGLGAYFGAAAGCWGAAWSEWSAGQ